MREQILKILRTINPYDEIDENSQLIEDEILDSLTLVIFISELENHFHIQVPEDKLQPEWFENVQKIEQLLGHMIKTK